MKIDCSVPADTPSFETVENAVNFEMKTEYEVPYF